MGRDNIDRPIGEVFPELYKAWKTFMDEAPKGTVELSKYGWYLGYDVLPKTPVELGRKLLKGHSKEVDDILSKYYEEELDNIENRIINQNPNRETIIKEAFENHRNKRYYSSIALLLTQVDGVCWDQYKKHFFRNKRKKDKSKYEKENNIYKSEVAESIIENREYAFSGFLEIFEDARLINEDSRNLDMFPVHLNRHEILHGMDYEYGTQLNSFKIISLLNFINDIVRYKP